MDDFLKFLTHLLNPPAKPLVSAQPTPSPSGNPISRANVSAPNIPYGSLIAKAAQDNGLNPADLAGALARESANFNPRFVSGYHMDGTGRGVAGIDKNAHPEIPDQQAFDPNFAIPWMAKQLATLKQQTGNFYDATREYNGGPNYASNRPGYQGLPVSYWTKQHADAIKQLASQYQKSFPNNSAVLGASTGP